MLSAVPGKHVFVVGVLFVAVSMGVPMDFFIFKQQKMEVIAMKKLISLMLALLLCLSLCACGGSKEEPKTEEPAPVEETPAEAETPEEPQEPEVEPVPVKIFVSVSDAGVLRVANEEITVMDADGDGAVTPDAVIAAAHDAFYEGGAEAGFIFENTDFGMSIIKLWGVDNGGCYGYYVNNAYVLPDYKLVEGDYLCTYSFADLDTWSDCYSFFDQRDVEAAAGEEVTLVLSQLVYDENWELQTQLTEGAKLIINGEISEYVTDAEGKAVLKLDEAGEYVVTAIGAEGSTLVPPVCLITVK